MQRSTLVWAVAFRGVRGSGMVGSSMVVAVAAEAVAMAGEVVPATGPGRYQRRPDSVLRSVSSIETIEAWRPAL